MRSSALRSEPARVYWHGGWHGCWLAQFDSGPCDGRLVRAHMVKQQTLRRELKADKAMVWADCWWVPACGGQGYGNDGHHGALDRGRLQVPRSALPPELEAACAEHGLGWYLDRTYGPEQLAA